MSYIATRHAVFDAATNCAATGKQTSASSMIMKRDHAEHALAEWREKGGSGVVMRRETSPQGALVLVFDPE